MSLLSVEKNIKLPVVSTIVNMEFKALNSKYIFSKDFSKGALRLSFNHRKAHSRVSLA